MQLSSAAARACVACLFAVIGCRAGGEEPLPVQAPDCRADAPTDLVRLEAVPRVVIITPESAPESAAMERLRGELAGYLARMWGMPVDVELIADDVAFENGDVAGATLVLAVRADAPADGYRLFSDGASARVDASDARNLAHGAYELLTRLGARFFHPREELVPALGAPMLPATLDEVRHSPFAVRGIQLHLLHPTEYMRPFLVPGDDELAAARATIDWLVKTGQNHVQWTLLSTQDWDAWLPHARAILAYAHERGVTVGCVVAMGGGGRSLQNQLLLVTEKDRALADIDAGLTQVMALPWDIVEIGFGEFVGADPHDIVAWLDHAVAFMAERHPQTKVSAQNHVGNYPELYADYDGVETFFYHLPGKADPRLVTNVHTVFFFDLYRAWAMYEHPNFHLQRDFMFEQLPLREVRYLPESAYWVSADIDVPVFLAEYLNARHIDIQGLHKDVISAGLPMPAAHVMYSSGHEWSYWMVDYLAARMLWTPEAPLSSYTAHWSAALGPCGDHLAAQLDALIALQTRTLFDQRLVPYASGDDVHDDLGYVIGIDTHPPRVPFEELWNAGDDARDAFARDVLAPLADAADEHLAIADRIAESCDGADVATRGWCEELEQSARITGLKLEHARLLYTVVFDLRDSEDHEATMAAAAAVRAEAHGVVEAREARYRFPLADLVEPINDPRLNPTRYPFGYLRQAHLLCLWERQELQVRAIIDTGIAASPFDLPGCQS